jgi:hypothetical protein
MSHPPRRQVDDNYSRQGASFHRKGAKMQRTQRKNLFCLALRPLQLGVFALEADLGWLT